MMEENGILSYIGLFLVGGNDFVELAILLVSGSQNLLIHFAGALYFFCGLCLVVQLFLRLTDPVSSLMPSACSHLLHLLTMK